MERLSGWVIRHRMTVGLVWLLITVVGASDRPVVVEPAGPRHPRERLSFHGQSADRAAVRRRDLRSGGAGAGRAGRPDGRRTRRADGSQRGGRADRRDGSDAPRRVLRVHRQSDAPGEQGLQHHRPGLPGASRRRHGDPADRRAHRRGQVRGSRSDRARHQPERPGGREHLRLGELQSAGGTADRRDRRAGRAGLGVRLDAGPAAAHHGPDIGADDAAADLRHHVRLHEVLLLADRSLGAGHGGAAGSGAVDRLLAAGRQPLA